VASRRTRKAFVDTNVFVRFLTGDDPAKAERSKALLDSAEEGSLELHLSHLTVAELAWTLRRFYGIPRTRIAESLADLLALKSVRVPELGLLSDAVGTYGRRPTDFIDAYHAVDMARRGLRTIYSFDKDFDRLGVRRLEP
jgi:predicted nucleic acid-binding protein